MQTKKTFTTPPLNLRPANRPEVPSSTAAGKEAEFKDLRDELDFILEVANFFLAGGDNPGRTVQDLVMNLQQLRQNAGAEMWRRLVPHAQEHPVRHHLLQDPFTARSFNKPRGYAGDGVLLDLLYRHEDVAPVLSASSQLGRDIYSYTSVSSSSEAVQERRVLLGKLADEIAQRVTKPEILSVASGHLREAELSEAFKAGDIGRWIAFDQDPANIATVTKAFDGTAVEPMKGQINAIATGKVNPGTFDFVYTAGVYDYLSFEAAVGLTRALLRLAKPGGEVLFANFTNEVVPLGYMETFMDWQLILRDEPEMQAIIDASVKDGDEVSIFHGENRHIIYARIRKAA